MHGSTAKLESGFRGAQLQTGRLGNQFASLASQIAGVHPIVGNLAQVMGNFAIGGAVTVGILGATAIFATFYDKLTEGARKAKKENDALIKSLSDRIFRDALGPEADLRLQTDAQRNTLRAQQQQRRKLLAFGVDEDDERILELNHQIAFSQSQLIIGEQKLFDARMKAGTALETVNVIGKKAVDALKFSYDQLRDAITKTRQEAERSGEEFWRNLANQMFESEELTKSLMPQMGVGPVDISDSAKLAGQQAKDINDAATRNAENVQQAIWGAASQSAGLIVSALNLGGGGKGSGLGGALGSTAGFAAGMFFSGGNPIGGAIGSTIGGIAGSLFGGLFDSNKQAVNSNTQAIKQLTQAMTLNTPSGFKVNRFRNDAADAVNLGLPNSAGVTIAGPVYVVANSPKEFAKQMRGYAARGGAPLLSGA